MILTIRMTPTGKGERKVLLVKGRLYGFPKCPNRAGSNPAMNGLAHRNGQGLGRNDSRDCREGAVLEVGV